MQIEVLKIIEDALIGGRNGEMAYIENNPFVAQIFRESGKPFNEFLKDCLDVNPKENIQEDRFIVKEIKINEYSEEYKEYKEAQDEVNKANKKLQDKKEELAKSLDDTLYKISTYDIKHREYCTNMKFKIAARKIKN